MYIEIIKNEDLPEDRRDNEMSGKKRFIRLHDENDICETVYTLPLNWRNFWRIIKLALETKKRSKSKR